jgi:hypothetical protein
MFVARVLLVSTSQRSSFFVFPKFHQTIAQRLSPLFLRAISVVLERSRKHGKDRSTFRDIATMIRVSGVCCTHMGQAGQLSTFDESTTLQQKDTARV